MLRDLDDFHKTPVGYATFGVVELTLSYAILSRAIDTGSLWQYGLGIILLIGAFRNFFHLVHKHTELVHKPYVRKNKRR